ncbi:hypothetical protein [Winogradskyella sp. R77965]|uniref:hypothetical protein n=1 Tax=Winogradskyella sp. R77965 TaxID=3093872 RepID=UPI0037DD7AE5
MEIKFIFINLLFFYISFSQTNEKITTIETVEVLNNNREEAIYYFQNNWKSLREKAVERGYIHSYAIMESTYSDKTPFHITLLTTYTNEEQHKNREAHFAELIKESDGLKLLNEKKPTEFRKSVFSIDAAKHLK